MYNGDSNNSYIELRSGNNTTQGDLILDVDGFALRGAFNNSLNEQKVFASNGKNAVALAAKIQGTGSNNSLIGLKPSEIDNTEMGVFMKTRKSDNNNYQVGQVLMCVAKDPTFQFDAEIDFTDYRLPTSAPPSDGNDYAWVVTNGTASWKQV